MLVHAVWMVYRNQLIYYSADTAYLSIGFANFFVSFLLPRRMSKRDPLGSLFRLYSVTFAPVTIAFGEPVSFLPVYGVLIPFTGFIRFVYLLSIPVQQHQTGEIACLHSTVGQTVKSRQESYSCGQQAASA